LGAALGLYFYRRSSRPLRREHSDIEANLWNIWQKLRKDNYSNDREATLLLHCEAAWNMMEAIKTRAAQKQGTSVMILCRSMFERAAAVDYLARSTEADLIRDYIDYGKIVAYEVAEAMKAPQSWLDNFKAEYDAIKTKRGQKKWHGGSVSSLVKRTEFHK